jgi:predicted ATPase
LEKYQSLESIRESQQGIKTKLYLAYLNAQDVFESIKSDFIAIFPYVEDLKIEPFKEESEIGSFLSKIPFIQIKEKGVAHWIHQGQMSAGMFRSLMHIAEIYLCAEGSVLLIDEFENSLGANCIDEMMDYLTSHERNLQLIITSHHPYIINRIPFKFWKLVTRASGKVVTRNATEFNLGKSKHEAFLQLINLDEYNEGIVT